MNWNDLRYFLEVARTGRYLSAARRLGVTHTTVSRRIHALEQALETPLFESDDKGLHLTPAGESILPLAQQCEDIAALTHERAAEDHRSLSGNLRIGAPDGLGNLFLADKLTGYIHQNPELNIRLVPVPQNLNLINREVDIAVTLEPSQRKDTHCQKLTDYSLYLYVSTSYADKNNVDLTNLNEIITHPFAGYIPDILYTEQLNFNQYIAPDLQESFQGATVISQFQFVANGGGFGVLPYFMVQNDSRFIQVLPEKINFLRSYWVLIPIELRRRAIVRSIERELQSLVIECRDQFVPRVSK